MTPLAWLFLVTTGLAIGFSVVVAIVTRGDANRVAELEKTCRDETTRSQTLADSAAQAEGLADDFGRALTRIETSPEHGQRIICGDCGQAAAGKIEHLDSCSIALPLNRWLEITNLSKRPIRQI